MPIDPVRDAAVNILLRVLEQDAYLDILLDKTLRKKTFAPRGRRFLTQLVYGTTRHRRLCEHALLPVLHDPLEKLPPPIRVILVMGAYQGLFLNQVTPPALVHTSVELAKRHGHAGTARLVNAVLKRIPHAVDEIALPDASECLVEHLAVRHSYPDWMVRRWVEQFGPEAAETLCRVLNEQSLPTLRVNTLRTDVDTLKQSLAKAECTAEKRTRVPEELTVTAGEPPARTKLFPEGLYLVQDAASMLPAHAMEPKSGESILDLCAAPGTKTTQLAQLAGGEAAVTACDVHWHKLLRVRENVERLGFTDIVVAGADGTKPPFMPGSFDRVLVDAPCTGYGTIRRHPDIKWRARPDDAQRLRETQAALLRSAVRLCKNGGLIVYSVCTFTPEETQQVVGPVVDEGDVALEDGPDWMNEWKSATGTYRTLPHESGLDGFYLTRLRKRS